MQVQVLQSICKKNLTNIMKLYYFRVSIFHEYIIKYRYPRER